MLIGDIRLFDVYIILKEWEECTDTVNIPYYCSKSIIRSTVLMSIIQITTHPVIIYMEMKMEYVGLIKRWWIMGRLEISKDVRSR